MGYDTQLASTLAPLLMSLAPQILHMCVVSHIHVISIPPVIGYVTVSHFTLGLLASLN